MRVTIYWHVRTGNNRIVSPATQLPYRLLLLFSKHYYYYYYYYLLDKQALDALYVAIDEMSNCIQVAVGHNIAHHHHRSH